MRQAKQAVEVLNQCTAKAYSAARLFGLASTTTNQWQTVIPPTFTIRQHQYKGLRKKRPLQRIAKGALQKMWPCQIQYLPERVLQFTDEYLPAGITRLDLLLTHDEVVPLPPMGSGRLELERPLGHVHVRKARQPHTR